MGHKNESDFIEGDFLMTTSTKIAAKNPGNAYLKLIGSWASWLFDALDASIFGFVLLSIAHSFKVGLADVVSTASWFLLATGIGGYFLGNISDRIGRKKTILISVFIYGVGTLLCGFSHSLLELNLYRFIVGVAVGGLWSAAAALVSEVWKPEGRAKAIAFMQTGWSGGGLLAAIFAWAILDPKDPETWRNLFIYSSIPALFVFVYVALFVKESPVWLANLEFISQKKGASLGEIFKPAYIKVTLLTLSVAVFTLLGYWIMSTFIPTYLQNILHVRIDQAPVFLIWFGIGSVIGYLVYGVLADKIGRKLSFVLFLVGMTIIIPIFTYTVSHMPLTNGVLDMNSTSNIFILGICSAFLGFFLGYNSGFGSWFSELFPTSIRATAVGFCFNFGRVGAIAGIFFVPKLIPIIGFTMTITLSSLSFLLATCLTLAIRETKGTKITSGN
ncbi:MFS transporter [Paenibacillus filicis]|uniref:MFS transporter n=1 Tax=Paenibacillus gyeongsangnamensis TaxID=3388067 RepID=A0ABT4Q3Q0_9BACL|nr:MFS transporter [Paenibacillus filicis]MCZ8511512.1 MFS transporter [Paenibacillus filicis]